jgi:hypothetical protein
LAHLPGRLPPPDALASTSFGQRRAPPCAARLRAR